MLEKFVDSVLIIDDKEDEIQELKETLRKKDLWVTCLFPPNEKRTIEKFIKPFRNRKLIFLDLRLDDNKSTIDNISVLIRPLFAKIIGTGFGAYGIVMWTKHDNHISEFKEKIQNDTDRYQLPLFVVKMDKSKYLRNGFADIFKDLEDVLKSSVAANFFINWSNLIQNGKDKAITSIFKLIPDYQKQDKNLEYLLFKMAINNIGIPETGWTDFPLRKEAYKSFTEMLSYEINKKINDDILFSKLSEISFIFEGSNQKDIYGKYKFEDSDYNLIELRKDVNKLKNQIKILKEKEIKTNKLEENKKERNDTLGKINRFEKELNLLFAQINTKCLLDEDIIDKNTILPGRIYEIIDKGVLLVSSMINENDIPIAIEMTPPCDFANNKNDKPKLLGGFITKCSEGRINSLKSDSFYTEAYPLKISKYPDLMLLVFDFKKIMIVDENDLTNNDKFQTLFQVKDKLFADILQKMSSYTARLGLSIVR